MRSSKVFRTNHFQRGGIPSRLHASKLHCHVLRNSDGTIRRAEKLRHSLRPSHVRQERWSCGAMNNGTRSGCSSAFIGGDPKIEERRYGSRSPSNRA